LSNLSKPSRGSARLAAIDKVFGALANKSRRHILLVLLNRGGSMTSSEIADRFSCQWPTTTRHLRRLEESGLVTAARKGREVVYTLDRERLRSVAGGWLSEFEKAGHELS
jgi:DNA-binding transcriptional ArsR family regulator